MNFFDDFVLYQLDLNELEIMRERAHHFLREIQCQVELKNSAARPLSRFNFQESGSVFYAEKVEDGVLINPALPPNFGNKDISTRPRRSLSGGRAVHTSRPVKSRQVLDTLSAASMVAHGIAQRIGVASRR